MQLLQQQKAVQTGNASCGAASDFDHLKQHTGSSAFNFSQQQLTKVIRRHLQPHDMIAVAHMAAIVRETHLLRAATSQGNIISTDRS